MATLTTVRLSKGDSPNWGFRLQGGKDFGTPLVIQKVNGGSPAERAGLIAGDAVIRINNVDVYNLLHKEAQDVIVRSGSNFDMVIQRGGSTWKPSVIPTGTYSKPSPSINNVSPVTKTSLTAQKGENIGAIGTGHNLAAKPFTPQVNGAVNGGGPQLVNKQYNSPLKLYSEDAIAETISAQSEVLSTGALGVNFKKNEKNYDATNSAVYRMLKEAENDNDVSNEPEPDAGVVSAPNKGVAGLRHVTAPQNKPAPSNPQLPPGQNVCAECERLIVGVFVRIKDKNLHVECFKCATCGSSLKNVGYYNINNKLYCDVHAKSAAIAINNPAAIPIPSGGRAPASAISSALSGHSLPVSSPLSPKTPSYAPSYPSSNVGGPKPFSSVSAPLSPGGTLPRAAPLSPPNRSFNKAPLSPPTGHSYGSYSPASTEHAHPNLTEITMEECQQLAMNPAPISVPVYGQINISIPSTTHSQLDSIGSSPKSDYSNSSTSSGRNSNLEGAKDRIITEITKGLIPKLKRVSISETQSPRMSFLLNNGDYNKRVKSELVVPINGARGGVSKRVVTESNLPDHLTFTSQMETISKEFSRNGREESGPKCLKCNTEVTGPFITALGKIWCPQHFVCATPSCRRPLQDIGFVEEQGQLYCEYCFEQYLAPPCSKCNAKIKTDCLKAIGKNFHPECFNCVYCGKLFGNSPFFLEDGNPYCEADWNELFTTKCFACGFPVEAGDRWVEALNNNYHSQCFNCTMCKKNLEGQSFFAKGGRPFCKNHAR